MSALRIALHGRSGSGKSVVCSYLRDKFKMEVASTGELCREVSRIVFGSESRRHLNEVSSALRGVSGDVWIEAALRRAVTSRVVFDSIRYRGDLVRLRREGFSLWTVCCPADLARTRLMERGQSFLDEDLEHESEVSLLGSEFDVTIDNGERPWNDVCIEIDEAVFRLVGKTG